MERRGEEIHIDSDKARAGSTPHVMRWVLGVSLTLAIIAMSAVWIIPSLLQGETVAENDTAAAKAREGRR